MGKFIFLVLGLLLILTAGIQAAAKEPLREAFGLQLGMSEEAVHRRMGKIATQQKEDKEGEGEGEQEVWILKSDAKFSYLLTRFDSKHRLVLITVVARPEAQVRYSDIGEVEVAKKATDGRTYSYKWRVQPTRQRPGYLLIARGSSPELLTSYSLYLAQ